MNSKCYKVFNSKKSQRDAAATCASLSAQLPTINNKDENEFLRGKNPGYLIISLTDVKKEGSFLWANGKAAGYTNWNKARPDNYHNEDCVVQQKDGLWEDQDCVKHKHPFMCEKFPEHVCKIGAKSYKDGGRFNKAATCEQCTCVVGNEVCAAPECKACPGGSVPVMQEGQCCPR